MHGPDTLPGRDWTVSLILQDSTVYCKTECKDWSLHSESLVGTMCHQNSSSQYHITQADSCQLPLDVTARKLDADPNATSTGVEVMLCFMKVRFLAATSVSLNSLTTLSSQAVARQEPSALKARPPTWSVCPCSSLHVMMWQGVGTVWKLQLVGQSGAGGKRNRLVSFDK